MCQENIGNFMLKNFAYHDLMKLLAFKKLANAVFRALDKLDFLKEYSTRPFFKKRVTRIFLEY